MFMSYKHKEKNEHTGCHRLTQWKPHGITHTVHTVANGRTGVTDGWRLLSYLRPGEPTPRSEVWTLVPQSPTSKEGAEAEG